jgi:hypothetical protein
MAARPLGAHMSGRHLKLIAGFLLVTAAAPAYAYLDPVTGSAIIQGFIAAVAAVGITARLYWHRVTQLFSRKKPPANEQTDERPGPSA